MRSKEAGESSSSLFKNGGVTVSLAIESPEPIPVEQFRISIRQELLKLRLGVLIGGGYERCPSFRYVKRNDLGRLQCRILR
jgi:hypothetical protein